MTTECLTLAEKKTLTAAAWQEFRRKSTSIDRRASWSAYVEADDRLWKSYLVTERAIASVPTKTTERAA